MYDENKLYLSLSHKINLVLENSPIKLENSASFCIEDTEAVPLVKAYSHLPSDSLNYWGSLFFLYSLSSLKNKICDLLRLAAVKFINSILSKTPFTFFTEFVKRFLNANVL